MTNPNDVNVENQYADESSILGYMMIVPESYGMVILELSPCVFRESRNRILFRAIKTCWEHNKPIDIVLVRDTLKDMGQLEKIGGSDYLKKVAEMVKFPYDIDLAIAILHREPLGNITKNYTLFCQSVDVQELYESIKLMADDNIKIISKRILAGIIKADDSYKYATQNEDTQRSNYYRGAVDANLSVLYLLIGKLK